MLINIRTETCGECLLFFGRHFYDHQERQSVLMGLCKVKENSGRGGLFSAQEAACDFSIARDAARKASTGDIEMLALVEPEILIVS